MTIDPACTVSCTATPGCTVCGRRKKLRGRDYGATANSYCDHECPGYDQEPLSGHLWPSEWRAAREARHG